MKCDNCGKHDLKIVEGWESDEALECPGCGQYYYYVGRIPCGKYYTGKPIPLDAIEKELKIKK